MERFLISLLSSRNTFRWHSRSIANRSLVVVAVLAIVLPADPFVNGLAVKSSPEDEGNEEHDRHTESETIPANVNICDSLLKVVAKNESSLILNSSTEDDSSEEYDRGIELETTTANVDISDSVLNEVAKNESTLILNSSTEDERNEEYDRHTGYELARADNITSLDEKHNDDISGLVSEYPAKNESHLICPKFEDIFYFSPKCIHAASNTLNRMKMEVDPCEDFYTFACGKFIEERRIPDNRFIVDTLSEIVSTSLSHLQIILKEKRNETDPSYLNFPAELYLACMNSTLIDDLGSEPLKGIIDTLGGWPVVVGESWESSNKWNLQETVRKLKLLRYDANYIFGFGVFANPKNVTINILTVGEPDLGLERKYLRRGFTDSRVLAYYKYMVDIAILLGAELSTAETNLRESLEFEIHLANITLSAEKLRSHENTYNIRTINELQAEYPYIQWLRFFRELFANDSLFDENTKINVQSSTFLKNLGLLLEKTDDRVVANYMMYRFILSSVKYLGKEFRTPRLQYSSITTGIIADLPRSEECIDIVATSFSSFALGFLYVNKFFSNESKAAATEIFNDVRDAFEEVLDESDWMDEKTRKDAKRKLKNINVYMGYPEDLLDTSKLEELYAGLEIDPQKYFQSIINLQRRESSYYLNRIKMPANETIWFDHAAPTLVNAYYQRNENSIIVPAAILQGHIFNAEHPQYMNYGALGYAIAHELTHGFDDFGRQYDHDGNLANWWQSDTEMAFLEKPHCLIEQYGNFTNKQTGLLIKDINAPTENIADIGGVKVSYLAYSKWLTKNRAELKLPGLQNYTSKQMFWISAAQVWCDNIKTDVLKEVLTSGVHIPSNFRILVAFKNNKNFAKDFQCSQGRPMNPEKKCEVW